MVIKFSDSRPGKIVVSCVSFVDEKKIIEHIIFDENDDEVFANKNLVQCIRMSVKLQGIKKILPCNKPIEDLFELAPPAKRTGSKRGDDGYVSPGVAIVWKDNSD